MPVKEACDLRRVALEVQLQDDGGVREAAHIQMHAFSRHGVAPFAPRSQPLTNLNSLNC